MQVTTISSRLAVDYSPATQSAFDSLITALGVVPAGLFSAEDLFVKLIGSATAAETALPEAQKQNNFGYSIGEGGSYRATIKAAVSTALTIVG